MGIQGNMHRNKPLKQAVRKLLYNWQDTLLINKSVYCLTNYEVEIVLFFSVAYFLLYDCPMPGTRGFWSQLGSPCTIITAASTMVAQVLSGSVKIHNFFLLDLGDLLTLTSWKNSLLKMPGYQQNNKHYLAFKSFYPRSSK